MQLWENIIYPKQCVCWQPGTIKWTMYSLLARFMGTTWGPSGAGWTQVGLMLAPWTLLSGNCCFALSRGILILNFNSTEIIYIYIYVYIPKEHNINGRFIMIHFLFQSLNTWLLGSCSLVILVDLWGSVWFDVSCFNNHLYYWRHFSPQYWYTENSQQLNHRPCTLEDGCIACQLRAVSPLGYLWSLTYRSWKYWSLRNDWYFVDDILKYIQWEIFRF